MKVTVPDMVSHKILWGTLKPWMGKHIHDWPSGSIPGEAEGGHLSGFSKTELPNASPGGRRGLDKPGACPETARSVEMNTRLTYTGQINNASLLTNFLYWSGKHSYYS